MSFSCHRRGHPSCYCAWYVVSNRNYPCMVLADQMYDSAVIGGVNRIESDIFSLNLHRILVNYFSLCHSEAPMLMLC